MADIDFTQFLISPQDGQGSVTPNQDIPIGPSGEILNFPPNTNEKNIYGGMSAPITQGGNGEIDFSQFLIPETNAIEQTGKTITLPAIQKPNVFEEAYAQYPKLKDANAVGLISTNTPDGARGLESWSPDEIGTKERPRPMALPKGQLGVQIFSPNVTPDDVAADIVSHHLVKTDPVLKTTYDQFASTITPEQTDFLRGDYDHAVAKEGETRPFDQWMQIVGIPSAFRGYAFNQYDQKGQQEFGYTDQQKQLLGGVKSYLQGGQPKEEIPTITATKPLGIGEQMGRFFSPLLGPTEQQKFEEAVPIDPNLSEQQNLANALSGVVPENAVYQYKPYANRIEKEQGLFTPFAPIEKYQPQAGDSGVQAAGKALFNTAAGLEESFLSPAGIMLPGIGGIGGRVVSGLFSGQMLSAIPEQYNQMMSGKTIQEQIEGGLGLLTSLGFGIAAGKHALLPKKPPINPSANPVVNEREAQINAAADAQAEVPLTPEQQKMRDDLDKRASQWEELRQQLLEIVKQAQELPEDHPDRAVLRDKASKIAQQMADLRDGKPVDITTEEPQGDERFKPKGEQGEAPKTTEAELRSAMPNTAFFDEANEALQRLNQEDARANNRQRFHLPTLQDLRELINNPAYRLADKLAGIFGKKIVLYKGEEGTKINGATGADPALKDYIFLKVDGQRPHLFTAGHELWHHIELNSPVLANSLRMQITPLIKDWAGLREKYRAAGYDESRFFDEHIGDFLGDAMQDPKFWNDLAKKNPKSFKELATQTIDWLNKLLYQLKDWRMGGDFTKDIQKARDMLVDGLSKFAEGKDEPVSAPEETPWQLMFQQDEEYKKAEERDDKEKAQRLVDEAAKKAGYKYVTFHGTEKDFREFKPSEYGLLGSGIYTGGKKEAGLYGKTLSLYGKQDNPITFNSREEIQNARDKAKESGLSFTDYLKQQGYDSITETFATQDGEPTRVFFDPSQLKSRDPFTYDEQGKLIPLSERFNPEKKDIYFQQDEEKRNKDFYSQLQRTITDKMPNKASVEQIKAIIDPAKGSGVKPEELKWSNLEGFLEGKKSVTKEEVLDYLKNEGAVKFEERTLKEEPVEGFPNQTIRPKYFNYTLPNGENYREVVLTMPSDKKPEYRKSFQLFENGELVAQGDQRSADRWKQENPNADIRELQNALAQKQSEGIYTSSHFPDIPNYVAHMRLDERPDSEGRNGLFIEEIQSDRHQQGRERGYAEDKKVKNPESFQAFKTKRFSWSGDNEWLVVSPDYPEGRFVEAPTSEEAIQKAIKEIQSDHGSIPDAPFRKDWPIQMFKRALRDAIASGKEWVGWTKGETQAERYDLSKQVSQVALLKNAEGELLLTARDKNGDVVMQKDIKDESEIPDYIGKEAAQKLTNQEWGKPTPKGITDKVLQGQDLKVGGEGMKGFYDQILPKEIGKYVKKWGAKVEEGAVSERKGGSTWIAQYPDGRRGTVYTEEGAEMARERGAKVTPTETKETPIWKVQITPEMRESVTKEGQPMFQQDAEKERFVPQEERINASRGRESLLKRISAEEAFGKITTDEAGAMRQLVNMLHEDYLSDVALSIRQKSNRNAQGFFNFADGIVTLVRNEIEKGPYGFDRTFQHEIWHSLSRFITPEELKKVSKQYTKEQAEYVKNNPWFKALIGRDSLTENQYKNWRKFVDQETADKNTKLLVDRNGKPVLLDGEKQYGIKFSKENYRFKNIDEWFAEKMSDKSMGEYYDMEEPVRNVIDYAKKVYNSVLKAIKNLFSPDIADQIYKKLTSGEAYNKQSQEPLGYNGSENEMVMFQQDKPEEETQRPELNAGARDTGAYHYGDLGIADDTKYSRMSGGRGTGHFGTGTYFLGEKSAGTKYGGRADRPIVNVNLEGLNLAKPKDPMRLHDALKLVNKMVYREEKPEFSQERFDGSRALFGLNYELGFSKHSREEIQKAIEDTYNEFASGQNDGFRSPSTVLMQKLGYDGVDVRGTKADNTDYGSVVYPKQETPMFQQDRPTEEEASKKREEIETRFQAAPIRKTKNTIVNTFKRKPAKEAISYMRDAGDNAANIYAKENTNEVSNDLKREFKKQNDKAAEALSFVIEAKGDQNELANMRQKIANSPDASKKWQKKALDAIDFADKNFARLEPIADKYNQIGLHQVAQENANGIDTPVREGYVPHYQDLEEQELFGGAGTGSATGFRKMRTYDTFADSIANGIDPKSINAVDLLQKRLSSGQKSINYRSWIDSLKQTIDPVSGDPIATKVSIVKRPDGSTYLQVPRGYKQETLAGQRVAIKNGYEGIISALNDPSAWSKNMTGQMIQKGAGFGKSLTLGLDTYHLGRIAIWESLIKSLGIKTFKLPVPSYRKGVTLIDHSIPELQKMIANGEIPRKWAKGLLENKRLLNLAVKTGYNIGGISDALHQDWIHKIPALGDFNSWLFNQFQRGAMTETWLLEFQRYRNAYRNLPEADVARMVSKDLNTRFGNLGRQGLLKSKTMQDTARFLFLAPQWNEGLIRTELGAMGQTGKALLDAATGKRLFAGVLARSVGGMIAAQFIANQLINYATRGTPTWENPEEGVGAKISAWIPDAWGGQGFFLNPMSLATETTHLLLKGYERTGDALETALNYFRSRSSVPMRPVWDWITNKNVLGTYYAPGQKWKGMLEDAIPYPIAGGTIYAATREALSGEPSQQYAGQYQKQLFQTFGVKLEGAPSDESRLYTLANHFKLDNNIQDREVGHTAKYGDLNRALMLGNMTNARNAMQKLLESEPASMIQKYYKNSYPKMRLFESNQQAKEFLNTLNDEQRDVYDRAKDKRKDTAQKALDLLKDMQ